jgi:SAM-dependent methyltransferase
MRDSQYTGYSQWKGWGGDGFGAVSAAESVYFSKEMSEFGISRFAGMRIVEIGFGNGAFAAWAVSKGANYAGVELQPELVAAARSHGLEAYSAADSFKSNFSSESVDLIVAFDVFEHVEIEVLPQIFRQYHEALRGGGLLIVRVPSGDSPFSRGIQHGDITHKSVLGSSALRQLAGGAGFVVECIREPVFPIFGIGLFSFFRRGIVIIARTIAYAFVANVLMGKADAILTPNLVISMRK